MIHRHERERRIDVRVHDRDVEAVALGHRLPVGRGRAAQRINADLYAGGADGFQVDDVGKILARKA